MMVPVPPFDNEAERAVLAAMLFDRDANDEVLARLSSRDFYRNSHQLIFEAVSRLSQNNHGIDELILRNELERSGDLEDVGGAQGLRELTRELTSTAFLQEHIGLVSDASTLRRVIRYCNDTLHAAYKSGANARELLAGADAQLTAITMGNEPSSLPEYKDVLEDLILAEPDVGGEGIHTGYLDLDRLGVVLPRRSLTVLAAPSSMGKTSLAANIIYRLAHRMGNKRVAFFSLEMTTQQIAELIVQIGAHVDTSKWHALREKQWPDPKERKKFVDEAVKQMGAKIWIDEMSNSFQAIRARTRQLKRREDIDIVVVDFLQEMEDLPGSKNRHQGVGGNARGLRRMAKELDVNVLLLSQISQEGERATRNTPIRTWLNWLKESGDIRNTADQILFLYRPNFYDEEDSAAKDGAETQLVVGKNRTGPTGKVDLLWFGEHRRFEDKAGERLVQLGDH